MVNDVVKWLVLSDFNTAIFFSLLDNDDRLS
jgi:hypothetical protein